ncbi:hypothetical protein C453_12881 [Haloferax elongans ATCC BAA-1513]|uniref:HTH marR-type domain-containing protein n=1 Tax=Haloferax elongans ATCC BAA-1513 TaxID=1230453 RepID=M0HIX2_HALEO|nr:MarR family transcriptional regulator [Haloferax elongans]ELZ84441.1 hypothetical protein C453_12881 [Haloferax elongans ATCC BAA-1513]
MPSITQQERIERIEEDDGDPNDIVYLSSYYNQQAAYHEDRDCSWFNVDDDNVKEKTRAWAQNRLRYPCGFCVLDRYQEGASNVHRDVDAVGVPDAIESSEPVTKLVWLALLINGPMSTVELTEVTSMSRSAVKRGIDTLADEELVESRIDPRDARRKRHTPLPIP